MQKGMAPVNSATRRAAAAVLPKGFGFARIDESTGEKAISDSPTLVAESEHLVGSASSDTTFRVATPVSVSFDCNGFRLATGAGDIGFRPDPPRGWFRQEPSGEDR